jgi:glucose-6-phosphate 1-epimerase
MRDPQTLDGLTGMLCVQAANAMDDAVKLGPGERHAMGVVIRAAAI